MLNKKEGELIGSEVCNFFYKYGLRILAILMLACCLVHYANKLFKYICFSLYLLVKHGRINIVVSSVHDKIANFNRHALRTPFVDASLEMFLREALDKQKPVKNASKQVLNDCSMCLTSLLGRKRAGDSLKVTECGHVFCLECTNRLFDSATQFSNGMVKCPTCVRLVTRDQIVYISNVHI